MSAGLQLYIDWKEKHQYRSDREALEALGLGRTAANNWRAGISQPEPAAIIQMAEELGKDPTLCLLKVEAERKTHSEKNRRAIAELAKKIATYAAVVIAGFLAHSTDANSVQVNNYNNTQFDINHAEYTFTLKRRWPANPQSAAVRPRQPSGIENAFERFVR